MDVIHTAKVRHDWNGGGKLDLSVRQGESVEILRVKNNPGGKWLARSLTGNCEFWLSLRMKHVGNHRLESLQIYMALSATSTQQTLQKPIMVDLW